MYATAAAVDCIDRRERCRKLQKQQRKDWRAKRIFLQHLSIFFRNRRISLCLAGNSFTHYLYNLPMINAITIHITFVICSIYPVAFYIPGFILYLSFFCCNVPCKWRLSVSCLSCVCCYDLSLKFTSHLHIVCLKQVLLNPLMRYFCLPLLLLIARETISHSSKRISNLHLSIFERYLWNVWTHFMNWELPFSSAHTNIEKWSLSFQK